MSIEVLRGNTIPQTDGDPVLGISWAATAEGAVLSSQELRGLLDARSLPAPEQRLLARSVPGSQEPWELKLSIDFETRPAKVLTFPFVADASRLGDTQRFGAQFVCVAGPVPDAPLQGEVLAVDVSEASQLGHAPTVTFSGLGDPVVVKLGEGGPKPPGVLRLRLVGLLYETDKTFLLPGALNSIRRLRSYYEKHPGAEVLVTGHADTTGSDAYNLPLSEDRAAALAAYLRDDVDHWLEWYQRPEASKRWGTREDQHMLSALRADTGEARRTDDDPPGFYTGPVDGNHMTAATQEGVRTFQAWSNDNRGTDLAVDGFMGPLTRRPLVTLYMEQDQTTLPEGTVLATHGCGEFHPAVETGDNVEEQKNRRVEVFFFDEGIDPAPQQACPDPGCPEYPQWVGKTDETIDLRDDMPEVAAADWELAADGGAPEPSPSAGAPPEPLHVTLLDRFHRPMADTPAVVFFPDGRRRFGTSDAAGVLTVDAPAGVTEARVRYTPGDSASVVDLAVAFELPPVSEKAGAVGRLRNLGYPVDEELDWSVEQFQFDQGLPETGELNEATRSRLAQVHDGGGA